VAKQQDSSCALIYGLNFAYVVGLIFRFGVTVRLTHTLLSVIAWASHVTVSTTFDISSYMAFARRSGVRRSWPALSMAHLPLFRQFSTTGGRSTWASLTQLVFATCLYLVFLAYPLVPGLPRASTKKYAAGHLRTILVFVLFSRPRLDYCRRCINGFLHSPFVTS